MELGGNMTETQNATQRIQKLADAAGHRLENVKQTGKALYEDANQAISQERSSRKEGEKALVQQLSAARDAADQLGAKANLNIRMTEEKVAAAVLQTVTELASQCEGLKDYVIACTNNKQAGTERTLEACVKEVEDIKADLQKTQRESPTGAGARAAADDRVETELGRAKERIIARIKEEMERTESQLRELKEGAALTRGKREEGAEFAGVKQIREQLLAARDAHRKAFDLARVALSKLDVEIGEQEVTYLERLQAAGKDPEKAQEERKRLLAQSMGAEEKCTEELGKIEKGFTEAKRALEASLKAVDELFDAEAEQKHEGDMAEVMQEAAETLRREKTRLETARVGAENVLKTRTIALRRRMAQQVRLAEAYLFIAKTVVG